MNDVLQANLTSGAMLRSKQMAMEVQLVAGVTLVALAMLLLLLVEARTPGAQAMPMLVLVAGLRYHTKSFY